MVFHELTSADDIQAYVLHGLCLMRSARWQPAIARPALQWILALASEGHPLPPPGFIADVGVIVTGMEGQLRGERNSTSTTQFSNARAYEDYVVSKIFADRSIDRASDAMRRITDKDRPRALAFVAERMREQLGIGGVTIGIGPIKTLLESSPDFIVARSSQIEPTVELQQLLATQYQVLISAARLAADLLGPEDIFELERGTAIAQLGQRLALLQVVRAASQLGNELPTLPPSRRDRPESPTHLLDDDAYPVGGFSSISNRGSMESLLHSQLAYMEPNDARPDLFDVKYLRDELLYYSRDENQFYRRRRHFAFVFRDDLVSARMKDPAAPYQRIIMALATIVATVNCLIRWLSDEAITFELLFPNSGVMEPEQRLLTLVFQESIANGLVSVKALTSEHLAAIESIRRRAEFCQIWIAAGDEIAETGMTLRVSTHPVLRAATWQADDSTGDWSAVASQLATACATNRH